MAVLFSPTDPVSIVLNEPSGVLTRVLTRSSGRNRSISSTRIRSRCFKALKKFLVRFCALL